MFRENTKKEQLLEDLKETIMLLHRIPEDAPERSMLEKMAAYERNVIQACYAEGWENYYEIKGKYSWI